MRFFILSVTVVFAANVAANDLSCPYNSKGTHPKCICADDLPYDEINRICASTLNANLLLAKCPKGSEGQFPGCICGKGTVYVREKDECVVIDRTKCPKGSKEVNNKCVCETINEFKYEFDEIFWICRPWYIPTTPSPPPPCPPHQHRVGDRCEWDRCPPGYQSETGYWPDCRPPHIEIATVKTCGAHMEGVYPNCKWLPCDDGYLTKTGYWPDCQAPPSCYDFGKTGTFPNCIDPLPRCDQYYHRDSNGDCVRIKCPPGHEGDYQPNCRIVPKCPPEYPGEWPNCNIYATTPGKDTPTTPQTTTTRSTPSTRSTRSTPPTTPQAPTTRSTTPTPSTRSTRSTKSTPPTTPSKISTTEPPKTPPTRGKCHCDCLSDQIVIFRDNVEIDPSRKYKRFINEKHSDRN